MSSRTGFEIAIIGMSCRFPGSKNISEFWKNLCEGKELISHFTKDELTDSGIDIDYIEDKNYVRSRGIVEDADKFDADFFGFYPKEAEMLDPQQRLFLECCWEAFEDAGYIPDQYNGVVGVFGGVGMNTYILQYLASKKDLAVSAEGYQFSIGNEKDFLTTRVSYKLNLNGPSINVQTACSTSLTAAHIACMNLLNYQCDLAIAGGSTISFPQKSGYHYQEGMILSPDGHCKPFDKDAGGTVPGNGTGIVLLKRLEDALRDNDNIYAVIKGSAYNNDGSLKVGYTAPGVIGQRDVILSAYSLAEVPLESVSYIETHGTGTSIGDPIEIDALNQAFSSSDDIKINSCAIGSVKSNLGHLDTAAGVAGLIKTALMLKNKKLVPSINYLNANEKINFSKSPFYVNTEFKDWNSELIRTAGISSFGIGGTNVHLVLEEAPEKIIAKRNENYRLIPFSAKSLKSLTNYENNLIEYLKKKTELSLDDIAYTLSNGRKEFEFRKFTVANSAIQISENLESKIAFSNNGRLSEKEVVFMFSGQGSQYINMFKDLYTSDLNFKVHFDKCNAILSDKFKLDIKSIIYSEKNNFDVASEILKQTKYTQPALFVIEYSLANCLIDLGITPNIMVGHSIGEYVAACISGVMDLESALMLVVKRGELMQSLKKGNMLSIRLSESELLNLIPSDLDLAVINAPNLCVVSGENESIIAFEKILKENEINGSILHTSHAFHSRMMEDILDDFKKVVQSIELKFPRIKYMSNVTGGKITDLEAADPNYYVNHLRYTVRFSENVLNLLQNKNNVFIEVGPGNVLTALVKSHKASNDFVVLNLSRPPYQNSNDEFDFLKSVGQLWLNGIKINWDKLFTYKPNKLHLPTYVFDKKRFWINLPQIEKNTKRNSKDVKNWVYESIWKRRFPNNINKGTEQLKVLIFDNNKFSIAEKLLNNYSNNEYRIVTSADEYSQISKSEFKINGAFSDDYVKLLNDLFNDNFIPDIIIHTWSLDSNSAIDDDFYYKQKLGFLSLINISKALSLKNILRKIYLNVISNNIFDVIGIENLNVANSTILGAIKVIGQENENILAKIIDVDYNKNIDIKNENLLLEELLSKTNENAVAIRNGYKWIQDFETVNLNSENDNNLLRENDVYVITGGLGRIGLIFAQHLVKKYKAKLALLDYYELPDKKEWYGILNDSEHLYYEKIKQLTEIETECKDLILLKCDVSEISDLQSNFKIVSEKFGKIDGIFHTAGIIGEKTIQWINQFEFDNYELQSKPKIFGSLNLIKALNSIDAKFVLFQSSLSSVLGGLGFASYSAVNNFIDSLVISENKKHETRTKFITVNWDAWDFTVGESSYNAKGIKPKQAIEILENVLKRNTPSQIIISLDELKNSYEKYLIDKSYFNQSKVLGDDAKHELHNRPEIETEYVGPESEIEKKVHEEWKTLLGIEKIGIYDNFFELGGNSLIGTQLVSRIRKIFNTDIPLLAVFENATIKNISEIIEKEKSSLAKTEDKSVNDIISLVANLSEEEIAKLLNEK